MMERLKQQHEREREEWEVMRAELEARLQEATEECGILRQEVEQNIVKAGTQEDQLDDDDDEGGEAAAVRPPPSMQQLGDDDKRIGHEGNGKPTEEKDENDDPTLTIQRLQNQLAEKDASLAMISLELVQSQERTAVVNQEKHAAALELKYVKDELEGLQALVLDQKYTFENQLQRERAKLNVAMEALNAATNQLTWLQETAMGLQCTVVSFMETKYEKEESKLD